MNYVVLIEFWFIWNLWISDTVDVFILSTLYSLLFRLYFSIERTIQGSLFAFLGWGSDNYAPFSWSHCFNAFQQQLLLIPTGFYFFRKLLILCLSTRRETVCIIPVSPPPGKEETLTSIPEAPSTLPMILPITVLSPPKVASILSSKAIASFAPGFFVRVCLYKWNHAVRSSFLPGFFCFVLFCFCSILCLWESAMLLRKAVVC